MHYKIHMHAYKHAAHAYTPYSHKTAASIHSDPYTHTETRTHPYDFTLMHEPTHTTYFTHPHSHPPTQPPTHTLHPHTCTHPQSCGGHTWQSLRNRWRKKLSHRKASREIFVSVRVRGCECKVSASVPTLTPPCDSVHESEE